MPTICKNTFALSPPPLLLFPALSAVRASGPDSRVLVSTGRGLPSCQSGASHLTAFKDCPAEIEGNGNFYMMQSGDPGDLKSELVPRRTQESKQRQNQRTWAKRKKKKKEEAAGGGGSYSQLSLGVFSKGQSSGHGVGDGPAIRSMWVLEKVKGKRWAFFACPKL